MLFLCSIFFVLCCLCPQWVNGTHGFVEPRPRRSYHHSSECFPEATHGMSTSWWKTSDEVLNFMDVTHIKYPWYPWYIDDILMIYWWYIDDILMISMIYWWILIRSGEKLQISSYLDSEIFGCQRWKLPWISRISTAREEKHRSPPRPVGNSVVKPGFNQHFPHEFVWKITVKTCKNTKSDG